MSVHSLAAMVCCERVHIVVLGDGATWIWNLADEHFPGAIQIVSMSATSHGQLLLRSPPWAQAVIDLLSEGLVEQVIATIETLPPPERESGKTAVVPAYQLRVQEQHIYAGCSHGVPCPSKLP